MVAPFTGVTSRVPSGAMDHDRRDGRIYTVADISIVANVNCSTPILLFKTFQGCIDMRDPEINVMEKTMTRSPIYIYIYIYIYMYVLYIYIYTIYTIIITYLQDRNC